MTEAVLIAVLTAARPLPGPASAVPLPYVQGGSRWVYRSNLGPAHVRLDEEPQPGGTVRRYRWEIRLAGGGMREELELRGDGLFTLGRSFSFLGVELWRVAFGPPELTIPLPLEVGRRWSGSTRVRSDGGTAWSEVDGEVEALETVDVPAGRFRAYRIRLLRTDTWGTRMDSVIWLDPHHGVVMASGRLRWPGVVGAVQRWSGLDRLELQLEQAQVVPTGTGAGRTGPAGSASAAPAAGLSFREGKG